MDKIIIAYIKNELIVSGATIELDAEDDLLGSGFLDSLGMMKLISFVENRFGIKVPIEDMVIENFMNVSAIQRYLEEKIS